MEFKLSAPHGDLACNKNMRNAVSCMMPIRSKSNKSKRSLSNGLLVTELSNAAHAHDACRDPLHRRARPRGTSQMRMPGDGIAHSYQAHSKRGVSSVEDKRPHTSATTAVGPNKRSGGTSRRKDRGLCSDDSYISFDNRTRSTAMSSRSSSSGGHANRNTAASTHGRITRGQSTQSSYHGDRSFGRSSASLRRRSTQTSERRSIPGQGIDLWQPGSRSHATSTAHLLHNSSFSLADDYHADDYQEDWDMRKRHFKKKGNMKGNTARAIKLSQAAAEFVQQAERDYRGRTPDKSPLGIVASDASSSCSTVSSLTLPNTKRRGGSVATASTGRSSLSGLSDHSNVFRWRR